MNIKEATEKWVGEFNAISQSLIKSSFNANVDSWIELTYDEDDESYDFFPMWGTMWTFGDSLDDYWAEENIEVMKSCGFRVYEFEETGEIYFGIDGAGYNFYEAHWIPLYKARGLRWHNTEEEVA